MKIYDISQEVFSCKVYPGDPVPEKQNVCSMDNGDLYNLTAFSMCAHNGTHIDAPSHFIKDGDSVDMIPLEKTVGMAYVCSRQGEIGWSDALEILECARKTHKDGANRILINGNGVITESGAKAFAMNGVFLIGVTSQSIGPELSPMEVHMILLEKGVVLLEGLRLDGISQGVYFLCAQPLNLGTCEGAPVRAVLVDFKE